MNILDQKEAKVFFGAWGAHVSASPDDAGGGSLTSSLFRSRARWRKLCSKGNQSSPTFIFLFFYFIHIPLNIFFTK